MYSVLILDINHPIPGYTPALACAPNKDVADCLALILATMMPVSPSSGSVPSLPFSTINHYTSPAKSATFDSLPMLRSGHSSYCSFNSIGHHGFYKEDELNDSDSETYWEREEEKLHPVLITWKQLCPNSWPLRRALSIPPSTHTHLQTHTKAQQPPSPSLHLPRPQPAPFSRYLSVPSASLVQWFASEFLWTAGSGELPPYMAIKCNESSAWGPRFCRCSLKLISHMGLSSFSTGFWKRGHVLNCPMRRRRGWLWSFQIDLSCTLNSIIATLHRGKQMIYFLKQDFTTCLCPMSLWVGGKKS